LTLFFAGFFLELVVILSAGESMALSRIFPNY